MNIGPVLSQRQIFGESLDNDALSTRVYPLPKTVSVSGSAPTMTSQLLHVVFWRQPTTKSVNRIATYTRATAAAATPSVCRMGLFGITYDMAAETFTASRLAMTNNRNTTLWAGTFTQYEEEFSASETVSLTGGQIYGAAALCVTGGAAPALYGSAGAQGGPASTHPFPGVIITGQADIPASFTQATSGLSGNTLAPWFMLRLV